MKCILELTRLFSRDKDCAKDCYLDGNVSLELVFEILNTIFAFLQGALILIYPRLNLNINGKIDRCIFLIWLEYTEGITEKFECSHQMLVLSFY